MTDDSMYTVGFMAQVYCMAPDRRELTTKLSRVVTRRLPCSSSCKASDVLPRRLHVIVYAQHGHELMGCKSPVGEPRQHGGYLQLIVTTSLRQGQPREGLSEGSRRQSCEPRNTNAIEGRHPGGESAQHDKAVWFEGHGKWRGCATTVHALIWGDLFDGRSPTATGAGLRAGAKAPDQPPDPTASAAARPGASPCVLEQKSAEAIVARPVRVIGQ